MKRVIFILFVLSAVLLAHAQSSTEKVSHKVTSDTIIDINGVKYHLALNGSVVLNSTRWAAYNVGAQSPEENGNYYAWGEYNTKDEYSWDTYKYARVSSGNLRITKYGRGVDEVWKLEAFDDAAAHNWGGKWRMPTHNEIRKLIVSCQWRKFTLRGVPGLIAYSSKNKNAIFFPWAGCMTADGLVEEGVSINLWSSEMFYSKYELAMALVVDGKISVQEWNRCLGFSIRPVYGK